MGIVSNEKIDSKGIIIENLLHQSDSLLKTSYNYSTKQLKATFTKGTVYGYNDVPVTIYEGLKTAPSTGSYFNKEIVKKFIATKFGTADNETINNIKNSIIEAKKNNP